MTKKTKKSNENIALIDQDMMDQVVADLSVNSKDKKRDKFIALWIMGLSAYEAARKAGYSESYARSGVQKQLKRSKNLRERIKDFAKQGPERYRQLCQLRLATIAEVEGAALQEYRDNPRLVINKPQLLRQLKQSGGVLSDDTGPFVPSRTTIQILSNNFAVQLIEGQGVLFYMAAKSRFAQCAVDN